MLLIAQSGTGKTYLLNTISEALGLEHRHYNASLISFDDLVGFPYPDEAKVGVRFLETPATVWGAQSVLIDEISRCKPEHQNRLFSLVHERRIQGVALPALRYRWAAMNPCSGDQSSMDDYAGSEPLDPALADRFALYIEAADWQELSNEARSYIAQPGGEGPIANDSGALKARIEEWREEFLRKVDRCPVGMSDMRSRRHRRSIRLAFGSLRYVRDLSRAACLPIAAGGMRETCVAKFSEPIPQACWGVKISAEVIAAAHRPAWESASDKGPRWIHRFHAEPRLARKLEILLAECRSPDGTQAIAQFIASESREGAAAFSFAIYPAAAMGKLPIGPEGVNDLARVATAFLSTEGDISWQERLSQTVGQHPEYSRCAVVVEKLKGTRRERSAILQQLFDREIGSHRARYT
jgi:MoxR-like ATPase